MRRLSLSSLLILVILGLICSLADLQAQTFAGPSRHSYNRNLPNFQGQTLIESKPAGALVYVNERPLGKTPLLLPADGEERVIRVVLEGYQDVLMPVRASGSLSMYLVLQPLGAVADPDLPRELIQTDGYDWPAFWLSILFPGLGQASQDRGVATFGFGAAGALGLSAVLAGGHLYREGQKAYSAAFNNRMLRSLLVGGLFSGSQASGIVGLNFYLEAEKLHNNPRGCEDGRIGCRQIRDGAKQRDAGYALYSIVWIWSALDALFFRPAAAFGTVGRSGSVGADVADGFFLNNTSRFEGADRPDSYIDVAASAGYKWRF